MPTKISHSTAVILAIAGILMHSSKAVLVRLGYGMTIDAIPLLVLRMGFAMPFYLLMVFLQRLPQRDRLTTKHWLGLVISGVLGFYLASLFDFLGLQYIKASLERLILFTYPIMVLLLNRIIFKERMTRNQFLAMGITYLGMVIIFAPELNFVGDGLLIGAGFVLLSALCYALYLVSSGQLLPKFGAGPFTSYCMLVSCSCVLLHWAIADGTDMLSFSREVYGLGFLMAMINTVIPTYLISAAIRKLGASSFAIFAALGPISTIGLAYIFLDEKLTPLQWLGSVVIMFGVWLVGRKKDKVGEG